MMLDLEDPNAFKKAMSLTTLLQKLGIAKDACLFAQVKITHRHMVYIMSKLYQAPYYSGLSLLDRLTELGAKAVSFVLIASIWGALFYGVYYLCMKMM